MVRMRKLWAFVGKAAFWVSWPLLFLYLRRSQRTRVLVVADGRVLVVKGWLSAGEWMLPGGGLRKGEDPKIGATRELLEETSLNIPPNQLRPLYAEVLRQYGIPFYCQCFIVQLEERPALQPRQLEIVEARWVDPAVLKAENSEWALSHALQQWL
jgi:ADP-ribose pyrophosphatase YjhB (NUDIX family)